MASSPTDPVRFPPSGAPLRPGAASRLLFRTALVLIASGFVFFAVVAFFLLVPSSSARQTVDFHVSRGESLASVLNRLKAEGLIYDHRVLSLWARLRSLDRKVHWGHYRFELPISPRRIVYQMMLGTGAFRRVTIPEGLSMAEIAELMESSGLADKQSFLREAENPELLSFAEVSGKGLEGYLFPTTYYFTPATTERGILTAMLEEFQRNFTPAMKEQAERLGFSVHEIVTLASIIEKETAVPSERTLVSAVFHNRLKRKIALQSDPTVIYALKGPSRSLTRKDLQHPSPYNTYRVPGLPPGPICNPGLASLQAALEPASVPYLYFVSRNDGTHLFSNTIAEHNRAVDRYQREKRPPRL